MATVPVTVGEKTLPFHQPADPDAVLDMAVERETAGLPATVPYWAAAWESADALCTVLQPPATASTFLDLGCGTGRVGMVAAALGWEVTLADNEPQALLFAHLNTLQFGCDIRRVDWTADTLPKRFDTIAGSDVLYDRTQWQPALAFCERHLAPAGRLLLAEPGRPTADTFEAFATERGWTIAHQFVEKIRIFTLTRAP